MVPRGSDEPRSKQHSLRFSVRVPMASLWPTHFELLPLSRVIRSSSQHSSASNIPAEDISCTVCISYTVCSPDVGPSNAVLCSHANAVSSCSELQTHASGTWPSPSALGLCFCPARTDFDEVTAFGPRTTFTPSIPACLVDDTLTKMTELTPAVGLPCAS